MNVEAARAFYEGIDRLKKRNIGDLSLLVTRPNHQGSGVGSQLVKWGTEYAVEHELDIYAVSTPESLSWYERFGFRGIDGFSTDMTLMGGTREDGPDRAELGPFENEPIIKPNFVALNREYRLSNVWTDLTAPGYPDINADFGRKNLTFSNRVAANNPSAQEHRFLNQDDIEVFEANRCLCFFLQLALHQLIGHDCGKLFQESESGSFNFDRHHMPKNPFTDKPIESWYGPGETPETAFGGIATAYIECLAEGIGLYLMSADGVLSTLAPDTTSDIDDVVYCGYLSIACMGLRSLLSYDPGMKKWGQVHDQARFGLLKCFLNAGHGFATIHHDIEEPKSVKVVISREKIATVEQGSNLLESLTSVDEAALQWRASVEATKGSRTLFMHANTRLDGDSVSLVEYPETREGLIRSWVERQ
ncbi:dipeptidyl peptidase III [Fusarium mundagurra]|uniref:Dipeptidyl peptidase III n=1 Tax=Fusarium mundagurra TaxID=1567541 RepID=A0A8H6D6N6_9HYPO|nr:dipeptidyl peptidase III [Fusarium mundagurra]